MIDYKLENECLLRLRDRTKIGAVPATTAYGKLRAWMMGDTEPTKLEFLLSGFGFGLFIFLFVLEMTA